ncbi:MAG: Crp/Fnr family transcriptional regulator [Gammaproteobacteria bacterium]|nr:Crp/Fnr family transcriptional regulator [Gammaproteobacteria bacterium]
MAEIQMIKTLRQVPLFSGLHDNDLTSLAQMAREVEVGVGDVIIHQGSQSDALYVVTEGQIRVFLTDESGKEIILSLDGPGTVVGEISVLDGGLRSASVAARQNTRLLKIEGSALRELLQSNMSLALALISALASQVRKLTDATHGLALTSAYRRLVRKLYEYAEEENGQRVITERLTHQLLADMIGCSREMVSRIMSDLSRGGYIQTDGKRLIIVKKLPPDY